MSGTQHAVMWMGILLIVLRLFTTTQWPNLKAVFQEGAGQGQAPIKNEQVPGAPKGKTLPNGTLPPVAN
jgi:hypothetical protein